MALQTTANVFETRIYPTNRATYGSEWSPGIDADPRINVLVAKIPGRAAGYYSSADEYPTWVNEYSAQREMIYINALAARFATDNLYAVLAHEFCHMQQFNKRVRSVVWFNEGQAQLCERLNNVGSGFEQSFLRQPDTQLNDWPDLDDTSALHYGGSFLFLEWLRQHAGGADLINALMAKGIDTPDDLDTVLRSRGQAGVEEQFADFVAANALIGASPEDRYAYRSGVRPTIAATATAQDRLASGASFRGTVHQWAARYVELPKTPVHLRFGGARTARLIPTDPHSGRAFWWSDRADGFDASLTRSVDLRPVTKATLSFWSWYDIEKDFDYGYVAASTDGGRTWTTLRTDRTTTEDPNGNNLGHGLTGTSGGPKPGWVEQKADLGAFAGKQILLRFEYVTDGALNLDGWAIDDLSIPEIGWSDDAEADRDWTASGFIRSTNLVRQRFVVQILRFGAIPTVERRFVEDGALELDLDASADRRAPLIAVTGLAPRTTQTAPFELIADAKR
ncbi:MAG: immune inhibitor A [Candidatus Limnocylindrales bacterium]